MYVIGAIDVHVQVLSENDWWVFKDVFFFASCVEIFILSHI